MFCMFSIKTYENIQVFFYVQDKNLRRMNLQTFLCAFNNWMSTFRHKNRKDGFTDKCNVRAVEMATAGTLKRWKRHLDVIIFWIIYSICSSTTAATSDKAISTPILTAAARPAGCTQKSGCGVFSIPRVELFEPFLTFNVSLRSQSTMLGTSSRTKMVKVPDISAHIVLFET